MTTSVQTSNDNLQSLQQDFDKITNAYNQTMQAIATGIQFNPRMMEEAKEQLIEFAAEQERITNSQSIGERFLRRVANVPLIGKAAKSSAEGIRKSRLAEESVSGIVKTMYTGLRKQAEDVERTEARLIEIYEHTEKSITFMSELDTKITALLSTDQVPLRDKSRVIRMSTQVKTMIEKSKDKLESLAIIIPTTQACLEMIYQDLPISEADLLSDMAMSTGVAQINALSQDVKEMRDLSDMVSTNIWSKTQKSIVNLLEMTTISERDIARIEHNAAERETLRIETMKAAQKSSQQIQAAHARIEHIVVESTKRRAEHQLLLEG